MADIELVIKISEDSYKATCRGSMLPPDVENVVQGIKNGTPLPKGHGELVDRNDINERFYSIYNDAINCSNQPSDKYLLDKWSMCLDTAPTIIEADRSIEDDNT